MRTLGEITALVGGKLVGGNASTVVNFLCPLDEPCEGGLAFSREKSLSKIETLAANSPLAAILVGGVKIPDDHKPVVPLIEVTDPYSSLLALLPEFYPKKEINSGVSPLASVSKSANIGKGTFIDAFVSIGNDVSIGSNTVVHSGVVIYPNVKIGDRVLIHANAVIREGTVIGSDLVIQSGAIIGGDGFGYVPDPKIGLVHIPHVGHVVLEDRVEIGSNSCIDRATLGTTKIQSGTKIDNLVQVGHNTHIGRHSILCGLVGIAGSVRIGNEVVLGGHSGVADHVHIVDGARIGAKSGVTDDVKERGDYIGFPLMPAQMWRKAWATLRRSVKNQ